MCPHCGRDAPIVYRGALPCCTACGGVRQPLSSPSLNLAGKPSKVGGTVASVVGWLVLLVGFSMALGLGLLLYALWTVALALAVALPMALVALVVGVALVIGGRSLRRSGVEAERATRDQALLALTAHRGAVTASDAARALGVGLADADAMLTRLAKEAPDRVTVEVDDQGVVWYRTAHVTGADFDARVRVAESARVGVEEGREAEDEDGETQAGLRR
jgi:hypothetical protein